MTSFMSDKKAKKLKHVKIYDELYELIQNQTYPCGQQLPSEPDLASKMNVSRMTLRKALALLQEDGLISNVRGKGNFVTQPKAQKKAEITAFHPIRHYCTKNIENTEIDFRIEPPTREVSDRLQQKTPAVVIADRWYQHEGRPIAYSLTFLPIEVIAKEDIDLNDPDSLLSYLEKLVYEKDYNYQLVCSHSKSGNFTSAKYTLSSSESFLLIHEAIYDQTQKMILSTKHYIPIDLFRIEIDGHFVK